ncbi:hypothetical protein LCGC14_2595680, partial [marine sediment metagenome]
MTNCSAERALAGFVADVRRLVAERVEGSVLRFADGVDVVQLLPGKMLRTRLAARLTACGCTSFDQADLAGLCAATELVHTASLCHDDVIDNALIRRARASLWQSVGASGAILIGDLLFCEAMKLVYDAADGRYVGAFLAKTSQVVTAEAEQELTLRGKELDEQSCLAVARDKTGPLFAFVAAVCGGDDEEFSAVLEEAGYLIGTAYQLADDLFDVVGDEAATGKTLGSDCQRRKYTLPQAAEQGASVVRRRVVELCSSAVAHLAGRPAARAALERYLVDDLGSVFHRVDENLLQVLGDRVASFGDRRSH